MTTWMWTWMCTHITDLMWVIREGGELMESSLFPSAMSFSTFCNVILPFLWNTLQSSKSASNYVQWWNRTVSKKNKLFMPLNSHSISQRNLSVKSSHFLSQRLNLPTILPEIVFWLNWDLFVKPSSFCDSDLCWQYMEPMIILVT